MSLFWLVYSDGTLRGGDRLGMFDRVIPQGGVVVVVVGGGVVYICSRFCVVTTMPAVRGRLGCAKGSLCFLLVACSDVDIFHIVPVMVMWWCSPQVFAIRQHPQPLLV